MHLLRLSSALVVLFLLCLALPAAAHTGKKTLVTVCGTGDSQDLLKVLAADFSRNHPGIEIQVPESIGTSGGIRAVAEGKCDLGRTARPPRGKENDYNLRYRTFSFSPVVFAVHPGLAEISGLTAQEAVAVFAGRITNWRELGGGDQPIYVANREEGDSCRTVLEQQLPGFAEIKAPVGEKLYSTPETSRVISRYAGTIGYVPLAMAKTAHLRVMALEGVSPSAANVAGGGYPYQIPLGVVWQENLSKSARAFLEYLFSPRARDLIIAAGAIPAP